MTIEEHTDLTNYTTFHLGGEAKYFVNIENKDDISRASFFAQQNKLQVFILGDGSNTIFTEKPYEGIIFHMENKGIILEKEDDGYVFVRVSAGENWDSFVEQVMYKGWYGLENLSYIPGTVGAAPVQNIGAYGVEVGGCVVEVECYDMLHNTFATLSQGTCLFTYRSSIFKIEPSRYVISSVLFRLEKKFTPVLTYKDVLEATQGVDITPELLRNSIIDIRTHKLPDWKILPTAGSFFKNPEVSKEKGEDLKTIYPDVPLYPHGEGYKLSAGYLIEHIAQMKGVRYKGVGVYEKHALVLVNYGEGTYEELKKLVEEIQDKVKKETDILLIPEVNII